MLRISLLHTSSFMLRSSAWYLSRLLCHSICLARSSPLCLPRSPSFLSGVTVAFLLFFMNELTMGYWIGHLFGHHWWPVTIWGLFLFTKYFLFSSMNFPRPSINSCIILQPSSTCVLDFTVGYDTYWAFFAWWRKQSEGNLRLVVGRFWRKREEL